MLHEFSILVPHSQVDESIEKLNFNGFYNLYYDQPIEQFTEENGYGFYEIKNSKVDLKVFIEDDPIDVEKVREEIATILGEKAELIHHQILETQEWQQPFPVINLQNGWYIKPTQADEKIEGRIILFEPPRAFGSGLHGTTQDCLRFILGENLSGKNVLDLGTGAGLLSVAAAIVGADQVVAVDIENVEAEVMNNAALNNVENHITVIHGNALNPSFKLEGSFDWILVNIAANEIKQLFPVIESHLPAQGKLLLSGMVEWNYQETLSLYSENGYRVDHISYSEEWVTAMLSKI